MHKVDVHRPRSANDRYQMLLDAIGLADWSAYNTLVSRYGASSGDVDEVLRQLEMDRDTAMESYRRSGVVTASGEKKLGVGRLW